MEILAERLILHGVPAQPHPQAQPAAAQHIQGGRLLGHQGGLALRQNDDTRAELEPGGHRGHVAEQHERLLKTALEGVSPAPAAGPIGVRAQHVVIRDYVGKAHGLHRLGVVFNGLGVVAEFGLWENNADFHSSVLDQ